MVKYGTLGEKGWRLHQEAGQAARLLPNPHAGMLWDVWRGLETAEVP